MGEFSSPPFFAIYFHIFPWMEFFPSLTYNDIIGKFFHNWNFLPVIF